MYFGHSDGICQGQVEGSEAPTRRHNLAALAANMASLRPIARQPAKLKPDLHCASNVCRRISVGIPFARGHVHDVCEWLALASK
jgi:hypothetical protein